MLLMSITVDYHNLFLLDSGTFLTDWRLKENKAKRPKTPKPQISCQGVKYIVSIPSSHLERNKAAQIWQGCQQNSFPFMSQCF